MNRKALRRVLSIPLGRAYRKHVWGPMEDRGWEDGSYQVCVKCHALRMKGDRYASVKGGCK